ncbi:MAG: zinc ribbon domain-containing protein, partial [Bdellovibrionaceae bacterium]|nr:zinc ribbon domain-containing protein [Pseudobdellovibrionaceae bacterium]
YYFKGGKLELLKTDDTAMTIVWSLLQCAQGLEADRMGFVRLDYAKVVEFIQTECGLQLKGDHFSLVEMKGLLCKRQSTDTGVFLQFELKEFQRVFKVWQVLREIAKWNETGLIDMKDIWRPMKKVVHTGPVCPECEAPVQKEHKFCASCGFRLQTAA